MAKVDLTLIASGEAAQRPWIGTLAKEFMVTVNVEKANIDEDHGWVQLSLEGPVEEIQRATAWLMTTGMHVEAEQRAVGA
jgi:ABC-type methionine transport system ATPase subunit